MSRLSLQLCLHPIEVMNITAEKKEKEKNTLLMSYTDLTNRRQQPSFT